MPTVITPFRGFTVARAAAGLLAGTAVLLAAAPSRAAAQGRCLGAAAAPSVQTLRRAAGAVVCLVNAERARHGLLCGATAISVGRLGVTRGTWSGADSSRT